VKSEGVGKWLREGIEKGENKCRLVFKRGDAERVTVG